MSSGMAYRFALMATVQKKLSEMRAVAHPAVGIHGTAAVASRNNALTSDARTRAACTSTPALAQRIESHPPNSAPIEANTGGIHASRWLACAWLSPRAVTRYTVVQFIHKL